MQDTTTFHSAVSKGLKLQKALLDSGLCRHLPLCIFDLKPCSARPHPGGSPSMEATETFREHASLQFGPSDFILKAYKKLRNS